MDIVIFNRDDCIDEFGARFRIYIFRKLLKLKVSDSQFIADKIANCQSTKKDVSTNERGLRLLDTVSTLYKIE